QYWFLGGLGRLIPDIQLLMKESISTSKSVVIRAGRYVSRTNLIDSKSSIDILSQYATDRCGIRRASLMFDEDIIKEFF
ncbi:unnamed protein product, partial [Rotaria magnacalcarata]